jgi:hypothetical protein
MITLGLVARDESKYLREWVAYHHLIGVEKFIIYLHNCADNSESVLRSTGLNVEVRIKNTEELGWEVKNEMYENIISDSETAYACCLDIDEFIFIPGGEDINEFMSKFKNIGGLVLYQNVFGPNGHVRSPTGLVAENYTRRNPDGMKLDKGLPTHDKPQDILKYVKMIVNRSSLRKVNSSHDYVCDKPIVDEDGKVFSKFRCDRRLSKIRINHYYTKSFDDWMFKTSRTRFSKSFKYPNSWFQYYCDLEHVDEDLKSKYAFKIKELLNG